MTSLQAAVHLRLSSSLPVRTHFMPMQQLHKRSWRKLTDLESSKLRKRVRALKAQGKKADRIAKIVGCSVASVYNYCRKR
jgi:hypothetical protein